MGLRERKQQAARDHVADAARRLFVESGYAGTTTREVAEAAEVSEGTVFNLFGSKAKLLLATLVRAVPDPAAVRRWREHATAMADPRTVIDAFCRPVEDTADVVVPLVRVFLEAATVEDEVADAWRSNEQQRLEVQRVLVDVLDSRGWLRSDRDIDDLNRDVWLVAAPELRIKWLDAGLRPDEYARWQRDTLATLLVAPDHL